VRFRGGFNADSRGKVFSKEEIRNITAGHYGRFDGGDHGVEGVDIVETFIESDGREGCRWGKNGSLPLRRNDHEFSWLEIRMEVTNLVCVHPFHGIWSEESFERFFGQLFLRQNLHDILLLLTTLDGTVVFEGEKLRLFSVICGGGEDRPRRGSGRLQSKIRRVRMGSIGGEYRGKDRLVRSPRDLDSQ
jgi:hypothetical protein